jgi:hypothetical protein
MRPVTRLQRGNLASYADEAYADDMPAPRQLGVRRKDTREMIRETPAVPAQRNRRSVRNA